MLSPVKFPASLFTRFRQLVHHGAPMLAVVDLVLGLVLVAAAASAEEFVVAYEGGDLDQVGRLAQRGGAAAVTPLLTSDDAVHVRGGR